MKLNHKILIAAVAAASLLVGCSNELTHEPSFDNQLYIKAESMTEKIALKWRVTEAKRSLRFAVPKPAVGDVNITCNVDPSLVEVYNRIYNGDAVILPAEYYEMSATDVILRKGNVLSEGIDIAFNKLDVIPQTSVYVLPVTVVSAGDMPVLQSRRTYYYVLKSSAIIEVVPDMEKKNYVVIPSFEDSKPSSEVCNGLTKFTIEALINVNAFAPGIQSVIGMEGYYLLRISDNGLAPNQLQVVTPYGNFSDPATCLLEAGKWTHVALTFDLAAKKAVLFINGVQASQLSMPVPKVADLGKPYIRGSEKFTFRLGYSYASGRELDGQISECRIWNVVRTPEQLKENVYEVDPQSPGLVAYWKLNEGRGKNINDYTGNGNDGLGYSAAGATTLKWVPVYLPEIVQ